MRRSVLGITIILLFIMIVPAGLSACSSGKAVETTLETIMETTTETPEEITTAGTPTTEPSTLESTQAPVADSLNPLTGLPLANAEAVGKCPVAFMINNIKVATPQLGLSQADLLYEMEVEGGITRMMAVFADMTQIPELGSIRSARHDYVDLAGGLDAILVHMGGSDIAMAQISKQGTNHLDGQVNFSAFWRDATWKAQRGSEHSVKTNAEKLTSTIAALGLRTEVDPAHAHVLAFQPAETFMAAGETAAGKATVPFSGYVTTVLTYRDDTKVYEKAQFGKPHIDLMTGEPLSFTNVLILQTKIVKADSSGHMDADLSKGQGYYLSGGKAETISWSKGDSKNPFTFTRADGSALLLNRGKSYIAIVSSSRTITLE